MSEGQFYQVLLYELDAIRKVLFGLLFSLFFGCFFMLKLEIFGPCLFHLPCLTYF